MAGISMDSSLITDFVPLSELYMMKRCERSSAIFYSLVSYYTRPQPLPLPIPPCCLFHSDSFNPVGLQ